VDLWGKGRESRIEWALCGEFDIVWDMKSNIIDLLCRAYNASLLKCMFIDSVETIA
jgi:hypothetical protein